MESSKNKGMVLGCVLAAAVCVCQAKAEDYDFGMDFVVHHNTTISQLGVFDGGSPLLSDVTVGIFDDSTGNLVGPEVTFGPGSGGTQVGNTLFENVPLFTLSAGEYSIISVGGGSYGVDNLGNSLVLTGGAYNSGSPLTVDGDANGSSSTPLCVTDPTPDGGTTVALLGGAMAGICLLRRRL